MQNRKLEIGAQIELATTEMQGAQRGLMLSYAMQDPAAAAQYVKLYDTSGGTYLARHSHTVSLRGAGVPHAEAYCGAASERNNTDAALSRAAVERV